MPFVPAICDQCYTMFSSGIYIRDVQVNLPTYEAEPCPKCMGIGHVRSGLYKFVNFTINVLADRERTVTDLTILYDVLYDAKENEKTLAELTLHIKKEVPSFADLLLLLPDTKTDFKLCLTLVIQALSAIITISINGNYQCEDYGHAQRKIKLYPNIRVNKVIDQVYTNNTGIEKRLF